MKLIPLTQGKSAQVDDEDFERLNQFKWYSDHGYAARAITLNGKQEKIYMHREIIGEIPEGMETDHIDGDTANNLKSNLRVVSHRYNMQNRHDVKLSRFPGVTKITNRPLKKPWQVLIRANGRRHYIGCFPTEEAAYEAYKKAECELVPV